MVDSHELEPQAARPPGASVILIGMPGAGKSTVGVLLAKRLAMGFVDTDILLQNDALQTLQAIVDEQGHQELRRIEQDVLCRLQADHSVIATGGSAIYSERAMAHLKQLGTIVYLRVPLAAVQARVANIDSRGLARKPGQTLEDLFHERALLYRHYADIELDCDEYSPDETVDLICDAILA